MLCQCFMTLNQHWFDIASSPYSKGLRFGMSFLTFGCTNVLSAANGPFQPYMYQIAICTIPYKTIYCRIFSPECTHSSLIRMRGFSSQHRLDKLCLYMYVLGHAYLPVCLGFVLTRLRRNTYNLFVCQLN